MQLSRRAISGLHQMYCVAMTTSRCKSSIPPVTRLSEEEAMMRDSGMSSHCYFLLHYIYTYDVVFLVRRFAQDKLQPLVREMDDKSEMDKSVIKGLFDQGVRCFHCSSL